ncbi:hypothetical protein L7F22_051069 [Adiantum nelumboides]|nr:hypothetical protein [Adiantum nelumboides]
MSLPINAIDGLRVSPNMRTPSTKFLAAQRGAKLKVPAIWFGEQWAHATYPAKWNSTYFMGAIKSFNRKKFLFSCLFESDLKVYYADWEHIRRYIVKENEDALKFDSCDIVEAFSNNDFDACYDVNDNASLDVVASLDGNDSVLEEFVVSSSRKGRGRPRKCVKRGRPKRVFETSQEDVEKGECREHGLIDETIILDDRPESSNSRKRGRPKKKSNKEPYRGITKPSSSLFEKDVPIDDDDNDSHASFGEGVDCDDATLEAEGGVLDDDEDSQNGWHSVSPPHWRSGDAYEVEPKDTFWTLPAFSGERGPDLGHTPREYSPFHLFLTLFPLDLIDHIINETNTYAEKERQRLLFLHDSMRRWVPMDRHSFLVFLGIALGMTLHYIPDKKYYWKDNAFGVLRYPNFGQKMSHTTFQQIKRFLHVRDNSQRPPRGTREHKLWQLLELEDRLNHTFKKIYKLGHAITVDERIIPSKCKMNPCRVYNPKKPHKFGIQVWNLCDSSSGYNYAFRIYDKMPCSELSFHVVADLVKTLPRKGHHVFFDRYFTSVKLLEHLRSEGQGGTGTYVTNRKHFPSRDMIALEKKAPRGSCRWAFCGVEGLVACSWMDKKEINFASNCFGVKRGEVKRQVLDGEKITISCPEMGIKYNEFKAGCDVFDSMVLGNGYSLQTTMYGFKWWQAGFWGMLDSVFTNAWIIWRDSFGQKNMSRYDFMSQLHDQMINNVFKSNVVTRTILEDASNGHYPIRLSDHKNSKQCIVCAAKRKKHVSEGKEVGQWKSTRTIWGCAKCQLTMCTDPCFKEYHARIDGTGSHAYVNLEKSYLDFDEDSDGGDLARLSSMIMDLPFFFTGTSYVSGSSGFITNLGLFAPVKAPHRYVDKEDFFISPLKHEVVILGAPWFDRLAASIKFPERKISFKFREKDMCINAQELGSSIPLVNDQAFDKSIKSSISAYMIFVKDSLNGVDETQVNENGMQVDLELSNFLNQFQDVFIDDIPGELPPKKGDDDHMIELIPGSSPPNKPPYRVSQAQQEEIMRQVNELVEKGMVRPSSSPFCSPVLLVQKKDGTYHMCVDYRALNRITIKNRFPVPRVEDLFDKLQGSTYFSRIDLKSGYHQIRLVR